MEKGLESFSIEKSPVEVKLRENLILKEDSRDPCP
jgi:hypothetical protein